VAVGRIAGYIFPALNSIELYRVAGKRYLPTCHWVGSYGAGNGSELSRHSPEPTFQNWSTFGTLALFVVFVAIALPRIARNFRFVYAHSIPLHFAVSRLCRTT